MNAVVAQSGQKSLLQNYLWLLKRELWEHRALYIAPGILAALVVILTLIEMIGVGSVTVADINMSDPGAAVRGGFRFMVYAGFAAPFAIIAALVTFYYALDALYADRRDRSVLFWKSLPVSDLETVLSKLTVAAIVAPIIAVIFSILSELFVFASATISLAIAGKPFAFLWTQIPFFQNVALLLYLMVALALWYLPIWAWCLLASAWARRAPFLWALAPIGAAWFIDFQLFGTHRIGELIVTRIAGVFPTATNISGELLGGNGAYAQLEAVRLSDMLAPAKLFSSGQLWGGILVAAGLVAITVWVRRYREAN